MQWEVMKERDSNRRTDVPFTLLFGTRSVDASQSLGPNDSVRGTLGERDEETKLRGAKMGTLDHQRFENQV